jgi:hypothetical protein
MSPLLNEFLHNVAHNLFKPLLLFFYMGFLIPLLRVSFEFPYVIYQGLTLYLLIAIGWHGGEELASLPISSLGEALGFMVVGFLTNTLIGIIAYQLLRRTTRLRRVDAATVAGYYGSDSAGTFVTCVGVLASAGIAFQAYMPVMLAIMEIPGCLVALILVSRLRQKGMDAKGNAWDEVGYEGRALAATNGQASHSGSKRVRRAVAAVASRSTGEGGGTAVAYAEGESASYIYDDGDNDGDNDVATVVGENYHGTRNSHSGSGKPRRPDSEEQAQLDLEAKMSLEKIEGEEAHAGHPAPGGGVSKELLHEVFLNPGIYLLFGGIVIGFISRMQGAAVTAADDPLFINMFQGILCLFLLEMGITASKRLRDLKTAGWKFIAFGLLAPNLFAGIGITVAHLYSMAIGVPFDVGTYVLFAVLCGAASYIAVPAVQRLAIPEASPTLPLAASLGLTFTYNVTIGIPVYIMLAKIVTTQFPVVA